MVVGFSLLAFLFNDGSVFHRFRFNVWVEALAVRIYVEGLSLRSASEILCRVWFEVSYESVRMLLHEACEAFSSMVKRGRGVYRS